MNFGNEFLDFVEPGCGQHDPEFLVLHRCSDFGAFSVPFYDRVGFLPVDFLSYDCLTTLQVDGAEHPFPVEFTPFLKLCFRYVRFPIGRRQAGKPGFNRFSGKGSGGAVRGHFFIKGKPEGYLFFFAFRKRKSQKRMESYTRKSKPCLNYP